MSQNRGKLYVISGPSGTGKGTICKELLKDNRNEFSVSMTTRAPREGEVHGKDYFFVSKEEFLEHVERGNFLEHATVFDNYYGTPKDMVIKRLERGRNVLLDIDVQGGLQVKAQTPEAILIFLVAPSWGELERRLRSRGDTSEEDIQKRLKQARWEYTQAEQYDYIVVSEAPPECVVERINTILSAEGYRTRRNMNLLNLEESL